MDDITRILEKIRSKEIVVWAGSGISKYCKLPVGSELVEIIRNKMSIDEKKKCENIFSLPEISQKYVNYRSNSKNELIKILINVFDIKLKNVHYHKLLTEIPFITKIVTTNFDRAFETANFYDIQVIYNDFQIPFQNQIDKIQLFKIHGDINHQNSIIITEDDYIQFYEGKLDTPLWIAIKSIITNYSILFIGYSFSDPHIKYLFKAIHDIIGSYSNEHFFIAPNLPTEDSQSLLKYHIKYINMTSEELIQLYQIVLRVLSFQIVLMVKLIHH